MHRLLRVAPVNDAAQQRARALTGQHAVQISLEHRMVDGRKEPKHIGVQHKSMLVSETLKTRQRPVLAAPRHAGKRVADVAAL